LMTRMRGLGILNFYRESRWFPRELRRESISVAEIEGNPSVVFHGANATVISTTNGYGP
jgi:hypothetical protein